MEIKEVWVGKVKCKLMPAMGMDGKRSIQRGGGGLIGVGGGEERKGEVSGVGLEMRLNVAEFEEAALGCEAPRSAWVACEVESKEDYNVFSVWRCHQDEIGRWNAFIQ